MGSGLGTQRCRLCCLRGEGDRGGPHWCPASSPATGSGVQRPAPEGSVFQGQGGRAWLESPLESLGHPRQGRGRKPARHRWAVRWGLSPRGGEAAKPGALSSLPPRKAWCLLGGSGASRGLQRPQTRRPGSALPHRLGPRCCCWDVGSPRVTWGATVSLRCPTGQVQPKAWLRPLQRVKRAFSSGGAPPSPLGSDVGRGQNS